MGDHSAIEWTDATWNPIRGCSRVSEGCRHCYAERTAGRFADYDSYDGLVHKVGNEWRWTGEVRFVEEALDLPLRWRRPRRIFVNSMSDLFHEKVPDEWIDKIFAVMALCPQHTFQVLTKRPVRMLAYLSKADPPRYCDTAWQMGIMATRLDSKDHTAFNRGHSIVETFKSEGWPLPNVWLGVSVEDQATADERIPLLLQTPAAVRWVSYEPALAPVDFAPWLSHFVKTSHDLRGQTCDRIGLDWLVVGGESGPGARPFDLAWARSAIAQCRAAGVPLFMKQIGSRPIGWWSNSEGPYVNWRSIRDRKGDDPSEWPEDLRVREWPSIGQYTTVR